MAWEMRTEWNLATNPKLTDPYGTIAVPDVANNLFKQPRLRDSTGAVFGGGGGEVGTTSYVVGAGDGPLLPGGSRAAEYMRRAVTTERTSGSVGPTGTNGATRGFFSGTPGTVVNVRLAVRYTGSRELKPRLRTMLFRQDGTTSEFFDTPSGEIVMSGSGAWQWVQISATATDTFASIGWWLYTAGNLPNQVQPAGSTWDTTAVRIWIGSDDGLGFADGNLTDPEGKYAYGWAGTANASTSYLRHAAAASGTANRVRVLGNVDAAVYSPAGVYLMADASAEAATIWTPGGTTNGNVVFPGVSGDASGIAMSRLGISPGKTYAAGVLYSQTGPLGLRPPSGLRAYRRDADGIQSNIYGNRPEDVEQTDTPLFVSFTIDPTDTDMSLIYQVNTSASNNVIRLRNLIICEGDTQAEALEKVQTYFDGSSPGFTFNDQYVKPRWKGTPFRSKSFFTWKSWVPDPPPTIQWDDKTKMSFQAGLDRGVLYLQDGTTVPWNGLTSVNAYDEANAEVESYYVDGLKLLDVSGYGEFEADLSAFTTPKEFDRCVGLGEVNQGLSVTGQQRESFGLSYRTLVGDSQNGLRRGYKIHLIYGATALSESENHETLSDDPAAMSLSWKLKTVAQHIPGRAPSAHLIIDTRYMYSSSVAALEAVLYGADQPPRLPTPTEVLDIVEEGSGLRVIDNGDGTFSVESDIPNAIKEISSTEFEIDWGTLETAEDTYTIKSF